jgi:hypothetical protein
MAGLKDLHEQEKQAAEGLKAKLKEIHELARAAREAKAKEKLAPAR